jgi:hypothetical protein
MINRSLHPLTVSSVKQNLLAKKKLLIVPSPHAATLIVSDLNSVPRNMGMDWESYDTSSSSAGGAPTYNSDLIPGVNEGYPHGNVGYLAYFRFEPAVATAHSPQPDVLDNPNKRLRI